MLPYPKDEVPTYRLVNDYRRATERFLMVLARGQGGQRQLSAPACDDLVKILHLVIDEAVPRSLEHRVQLASKAKPKRKVRK
jgi:type VI protein secretion system component VasA